MQLSTEVIGDVGVIRVRGEVDTLESPKLDHTATQMLNDGAHNLVIDIRDVDFIASDGLRVLVHAHEQAHAQGGTLTIRRPSALAYRLMRLTALDTVFVIDGLPDSDGDRVD